MMKLVFLFFTFSQSKIISPNQDGEFNIRKILKDISIRKYPVKSLPQPCTTGGCFFLVLKCIEASPQ